MLKLGGSSFWLVGILVNKVNSDRLSLNYEFCTIFILNFETLKEFSCSANGFTGISACLEGEYCERPYNQILNLSQA